MRKPLRDGGVNKTERCPVILVPVERPMNFPVAVRVNKQNLFLLGAVMAVVLLFVDLPLTFIRRWLNGNG